MGGIRKTMDSFTTGGGKFTTSRIPDSSDATSRLLLAFFPKLPEGEPKICGQ